MRRILHIHTGHCDNQLAAKFWELLSDTLGFDARATYPCTDQQLHLEKVSVVLSDARPTFKTDAIRVDYQTVEEDKLPSSASSLSSASSFGGSAMDTLGGLVMAKTGEEDFEETTIIANSCMPSRNSSNVSSVERKVSGSSESSAAKSSASEEEPTNYFNVPGSGMKDVHCWLKSLRLHKYSDLFSKMSYEKMMSLTEEQLEAKGVTKGARHKIILNITKLKNRVNNLRALEQSLDEEGFGFVRQALNELKTMLATPIKPHTSSQNDGNNNHSSNDMAFGFRSDDFQMDKYGAGCPQYQVSSFYQPPICDNTILDESDLPGHVARVLTKIYTLILVSHQVDDECLRMFSGCTDKCLSHEAFTVGQKRTLCIYKQKIEVLRCPYGGRRSLGARQLKGNWGNQSNEVNNNRNLISNMTANNSAVHCGSVTSSAGTNRKSRTFGSVSSSPIPFSNNRSYSSFNHPGFPGMERSLNAYKKQNFSDLKNAPNFSFSSNSFSRNPLPIRHMPVTSNPIASNIYAGRELEQIDDQIQSLCLRMTEQAIGGAMA